METVLFTDGLKRVLQTKKDGAVDSEGDGTADRAIGSVVVGAALLATPGNIGQSHNDPNKPRPGELYSQNQLNAMHAAHMSAHSDKSSAGTKAAAASQDRTRRQEPNAMRVQVQVGKETLGSAPLVNSAEVGVTKAQAWSGLLSSHQQATSKDPSLASILLSRLRLLKSVSKLKI